MSKHDLLRETSGGGDQPYARLSSSPSDADTVPHLPLYDHHSPHAISSASNSQRGHPSRLEPLEMRDHTAAASSDKEREWQEMQKTCKHGLVLYNCIPCRNERRDQQQPQQQQHQRHRQPQRRDDDQPPSPHSTDLPTTVPTATASVPAVAASAASSHPTHLSQLIPHTSHFMLSVVEARGSSSTDTTTAAIVVHPSMRVSRLIDRMQARLAPTSLRPSRRHAAIERELYGLQKAAKLAEWMCEEESGEENAGHKVMRQHELNAPQPSPLERELAQAAAARRQLRVDARRRGRVVPLLRAMLREGLVLGEFELQSILSYHDMLNTVHRSQSAVAVTDEHHLPDGVIRAETVPPTTAMQQYEQPVRSRQHAENDMDELIEELLFQLRGDSLQRMAAELNRRVKASTPDSQGYRPGEKDADQSGKPSQRTYTAHEVQPPPEQTQPLPAQPSGGSSSSDKKKGTEEVELDFRARAWCDGAVLRKEDSIEQSHITPQSTVYLLFTSRYHAQPRAVAYHHNHRGAKLHDSYAIFVRHQASRSLIRVHVHVSTKVWQVKHVAVRTCYELTEAEMEALDTDKDKRMGRTEPADESHTGRQRRASIDEESKERPPSTTSHDQPTTARQRQSTVVRHQRDSLPIEDPADADDVEPLEDLASPAERCVLLLHGRVLYDNDAMVFSGVGPGDVLVVLDKRDKSDQLVDAARYGLLAGEPQLCNAQLADRSTLFDVQAAVCQVREYVDAIVHHPVHKQRLWTYFKLMDIDHSGEMRPPELSWALHTVLRLLQQRITGDDSIVAQQWLVDVSYCAGSDSSDASYGFEEPSVLPPPFETTFDTFLRLLSDSVVELIRAREFDLMFPAQTFCKPDWWHSHHKHHTEGGSGSGGEAELNRDDRRRLHDNHRLMHTIFSTLPHLHALPTRSSSDSTADTGTPRDLASAMPEHMHTFLSRAGLTPDFALSHSSTSKPLNREEGEASNIEHAYILTQLLQAEQERQQKEGTHHNIHRGPTFDARRRHDSAIDSILRLLDVTLTEDLELDEADHEPKHLNAYFYTGVLAVATFVLQPLIECYDAVRQLWDKSFPVGWWAVEEEERLQARVQTSAAECSRAREQPREGKAGHDRLEQLEHEHLRNLEALWRCRWNRWAVVQRWLYGMCVIGLFTAQRAAFFYTPFVLVAIYHLFCEHDSSSHITLLEAWVPFAISCLLMAYSVNDAVTDRLELDANDEEIVKAAFQDSQLLCMEMRSSPVMLDYNTPAHEQHDEADKEKEKAKEKEQAAGKHKGGLSEWKLDRWVDEGKHLIATGVQVSEHMTGVNHSNKAQHRSIQHGGPGSPRRHHDPKKKKGAPSMGGHERASSPPPQKSKVVVPVHEIATPTKQTTVAPATVVDVPQHWWQRCLGRKKQTQTVAMVQPLDGGHSARVAPLPATGTNAPTASAVANAGTEPLPAGPPNKLAERKASRLRMSNIILNFRLGSAASQSTFLWWQKLLFLALTLAHTVVPGAYRQHEEQTAFFGSTWYDEVVAIGNFFCIPAVYIFFTSLGEACMGYHQLTVRLANLSLVASASEAYEAKIPYFLDIRQPNNLEYWLALREKAKHVEARLLAMMAGAVVGDAVLLIVSAVRVLFYKVTLDLLLVVSIADIVIFSLFILVFLLIVVQANTVLSEEHLQLLQRLKHQLSFEMVNSQTWDSMTMDVNEDDGRNIDTWSDGCVFDAEDVEEEQELRQMEDAILDAEGNLTHRGSRRASSTARRQSTFSRSSSPRYPSSSPRHRRCPHDLPLSDCMTCTLKTHSSQLHHKQTLKLHTVHSLLTSLNSSCQSTHSHSLTSLRYYRFSLQAQLLNSTIEHLQAMDEPVKLLGLLVDQKLLMQALAAIVTAGASSLSSLVSG